MAGGVPAALLKNLRASGAGRLVGLILLICLLLVRVWDPVPLELLRLKTYDIYQILVPAKKAARRTVMIVDIDEESLGAYGQWPWPRNLIADLITKITASGAVAIGLDIVFAEPDRLSPADLAKNLKGLDAATRAKLAAQPGNDQVLAAAFARSRIVLGQAAYHRKVTQKRKQDNTQVPLATIGQDPRRYLDEFPGMVRNIDQLEAVARGRGMFTIVPETDGIIRRVPLLLKVGTQIWPSLSLELLRVATGTSTLLVRSDEVGITDVIVARKKIPTDGKSRVWIHFSHHDPGRYISAAKILAAKTPLKGLAGKLVLVGTSATGLFDIKATPVDPAIPGVEVHAQLLESILSGRQLTRPNYAIGAELVLAIVIGLLIIGLVPMLGAATTLLTGAGLSAVIIWGAYYLFSRHGLVFDVAFPLLTSLMIFGTLVFLSYFREEYQRRQIRSAFGQYLSPDLVEQLAKNPEKLSLGGETKELTIMFSDVRGFTTIAEAYKDDPQGLTTLINRLLTPLSNVVIALKGTIDKYMGDNIMAFWNAPLDDKDHAGHACQAALTMLTELEALNKVRRSEDETAGRQNLPLHIGVGINTGSCVVGNIGSDMRFDYSVLGDSVNLASRLEGQTKSYGVTVILGADTAAAVKDRFAVVALDAIRVKGKSEPEHIFALLGDQAMRADERFGELSARHDAMLAHYQAGQWARAAKALDEARALSAPFGLATYYDIYAARIAGYRKNPPGKDWDGVYTARTK